MDKLGSVSTLSLVYMAISAVLTILVPITVIIFMGVKKRLKWKAMLFGALLFVVFVLLLERTMHILVLGSDPTKSVIFNNPILYMLYGGFAAGIFEETARLLGFKFLIKVRDSDSIDTGISYGLGHGGIEVILLGGLVAVGNLITSVMLNGSMLKGLTAAMSGEQLEVFSQGINSLITTPSYLFLITGVERMIALVLQIALSLFVFKAVVEKKWQYFAYAILIHAGIDMFAVLYQKGIIENVFLLEGIILLLTVIVAIVAVRINKKERVSEQAIVE